MYVSVQGWTVQASIGMGSPLGCTMANFFLGHLETLIFKDQMPFHPKLYVRYIDDVFAVFDMLTRVGLFWMF